MQQVDYSLPIEQIHEDQAHVDAIKNKLKHPIGHFTFEIIRRNIDARQDPIVFILRANIFYEKESEKPKIPVNPFDQIEVYDKSEVHIIGSGPCGYFAALECIRLGLKPILIERGKTVQERRRDLRAIQQQGIVNPDSNYCFGEGGAGTYSDGKLYTRSDKRGNIQDVLDLLILHGAHRDIKVDVHPHIGSNKLPKILEQIRNTILHAGGEIHFEQRVIDFKIVQDRITEIITQKKVFLANHVILATGHSARDIYELLVAKNIQLESKPFALGLRIEHPQSTIDQMQYRQSPRNENLPAAAYALSCQIDARGVFSFCMCPGGLIVPAATAPGEIVVNGMSLSKRDSPFANSGFVTEVNDMDFQPFEKHGELRGRYYQAFTEQKMFRSGDGSQRSPAQLATDFIRSKSSSALPSSSYIPGIYAAPLHELLPEQVSKRLKDALTYFGKKMKSYLSEEAVLHGVESRTSAPVRIFRDRVSCQHPQIKNLFPAGEGAGYAGGILSAAMDGQKVVRQISIIIQNN